MDSSLTMTIIRYLSCFLFLAIGPICDASPLVGGGSSYSSTSYGDSNNKCDAVRAYFEAQGFQAAEIPKEPVLCAYIQKKNITNFVIFFS